MVRKGLICRKTQQPTTNQPTNWKEQLTGYCWGQYQLTISIYTGALEKWPYRDMEMDVHLTIVILIQPLEWTLKSKKYILKFRLRIYWFRYGLINQKPVLCWGGRHSPYFKYHRERRDRQTDRQKRGYGESVKRNTCLYFHFFPNWPRG